MGGSKGRVGRWTPALLPAVLACSALLGCSDPARVPGPAEGASEAASFDLAAALRARGARVEDAGAVSQPYLSVPGRILLVNRAQVQVYDYPTVARARDEAAGVSPDGSTVRGEGRVWSIAWVQPPHFYRRDDVIALYVGTEESVRGLLEAVMGPPFAKG